MKLSKKFLSLLLCAVMVLGSVAIGGNGFAEVLETFSVKANAAKVTSYKTGDIIEFGWYPQSKETNKSITDALSSSAGNTLGWNSYNYYSGTGSSTDGLMTPSNYMRYTDVMYGSTKYRGIIFDSYRPSYTGYTSSASNTNQDNNGYTTGNVYWFEYEPIKWRVLDPDVGMVMTETILDSQAYNNYVISSGTDEYSYLAYWGDYTKTYYANNYEKSTIREWLNSDFYNTAFSPAQQNIISFTTLDNSAYSASFSAYNSATTNDKIYLLSYNNTINSDYGFSTSSSPNSTRKAQGSDYAKAQGLWMNYSCSPWHLRSTGRHSEFTCYVDYDGYINLGCTDNDTQVGVRPVLNFNLSSDIFQSDVKDTGTAAGSGTGNYSTGDYIYYGTYPQSEVTDSALVSALNGASGSWKSYGYYSGTGDWDDGQMKPSDYMRYKDVSYNGSKYRAVTFDSYRLYCTGYTSSSNEQQRNGYYTGNVYWFKYEPIKWRVLDPSTGLIMCDIAIDSQAYNNYIYHNGSGDYGNSSCTYYANNYAKSSIRAWLNKDFYNTAFSSDQKSNIVSTTLDNSSSYSPAYDAPSTTDKIFLLSYNDSINSSYGFNSTPSAYDTARQLKSTDYAKCQGCYQNTSDSYPGNCRWWLRSPFYDNVASEIDFDGDSGHDSYVYQTYRGVVPALRLSNLKSDYAGSEIGVGDEENLYSLVSNSSTDIKYTYPYSDLYFNGSSTVYSTKLMQASICLAVAAMVNDGGDYSTKEPVAAKKMFSDLDYEGYSHYGYQEKPASTDPDSAACTMAYKNIDENTTVIAVSVRGSGYEGEWGSNFNVGSSSDTYHTGFNKASNYILGYLNQFVAENKAKFKSNIKFWVTGYSRAAATANLVAAKLDKGVPSNYSQIRALNYSKNSVYAYTFETPQNTIDSNARSSFYNNIFNIVNRIDPVTMVAPTAWNFRRYGIDCYLPSAESTSGYKEYRKQMEGVYNTITQGNAYEEDFVYAYLDIDLIKYCTESNQLIYVKENKTVTQGVYLDMLYDVLANDIICDRNNYAQNYQASMTKFFKKYPLKFDDLPSTDILWNNIKNNIDWKTVVKLYFNKGNIAKALRPVLAKSISQWLSDAGVTYYEADDLLSIVDDAAVAIAENLDVLVTALYNDNGTRLFIPHYPCTTFAWVMACPELITEKATYSKAKFNCPVDVKVYDNADNLVAAIVNNEPQYIEDSSISALVDKNGQKTFCLPDDEKYRFEVTGNDEGTMTCSFSDYNFTTNEESNIRNYYNIPVDTETEITAISEAKENYEEPLVVTMTEEDKEIKPSEIISYGNKETYTVSVITDSDVGVAEGGGEFVKGEHCKVIAHESIDNSFIGWYVDGKLVSSEKEYRFMVDKDTTITGKFKPHTHNFIDDLCSECGSIDEIYYVDKISIKTASAQTIDYRSIVTIKATAENVPEGYHLALYVNGVKVKDGDNKSVSYTYGEIKSDINYTVKVIDANGKVQKDGSGNDLSKDSKVTVNAGFFKKLVAFFKWLFKTLPQIEVKP